MTVASQEMVSPSALLLVVLGWLLGTLSPSVVAAIARPTRRRELAQVIAAELQDLRLRAAMILVKMRGRVGHMDQAVLDLVRPIMLAESDDPGDRAYGEATRKLLERGDAVYIAAQNQLSKSSVGPYPIPYEAPFLAAHLADLSVFPNRDQAAFLRVWTELKMFNEKIAYVQRCHDRTFDNLSEENHELNRANLEAGLGHLGDRAEMLIKAINRVVGPSGSSLA